MKFKYIVMSICLIVIMAAAGVALRGAFMARSSSQENSGSTTTTSIQFISSTITADGTVTAESQEKLSFQSSGKLIYLPFKEGDKVLQGQVVAQMDTAKLQANLRQAEQDFTAAKASSEKLYNDQGTKTDESFDEKIKRTAVDAAQNKAYDAVVKSRQDITDATLVSSINGIITHEDVTVPGVNITPATSFTVANLDTMVFRANIPMGNIYYVSEGSTVTLAINGIQNKMTGTVVKIYPSKVTLSNGQSVYQADIASDELKNQANLDQAGSALISTNAQNVALVPAWTVLSGKYIWIDNNGKPELREITVGKIHGNEIEIMSGLSPNDQIIIDPKFIPSLKYQLL
jgi:membrane fusion protein, multidrug efflux system